MRQRRLNFLRANKNQDKSLILFNIERIYRRKVSEGIAYGKLKVTILKRRKLQHPQENRKEKSEDGTPKQTQTKRRNLCIQTRLRKARRYSLFHLIQ